MEFFLFHWLKSRTAKKYLHSYLTISIIPVLIVCLVLGIGIGYFSNRQAENTIQSKLEQLKNEIDANITCMENSALHLSGILSAIPSESDQQQILQDGRITRQLQVYQNNLSLPSEVVYYPRTGTELYTTEGKLSYHAFEMLENWAGELDMVQFYKKLNTIETRTFLTTAPLTSEEQGSYLLYLYPVPNMDASPSGTIAFLIPREYFDQIVEDYCGNLDGYFLMLDSFYGVSYQVDQCGAHDLDTVINSLSLTTGGGGIRSIKINEQPFVFLRTASKNYGFLYLYAVPANSFYAAANRSLLFFFSGSALLLLALLIISFLTTAKRMKPVIRLAGEFSSYPMVGDDLFEQIHLQIRDMESQNSQLQHQLKYQTHVSRCQVLSEILYGWRGDVEQLNAALEQVGIVFPYPQFFAAVVQTEEGTPCPLLFPVYDQLKIQKQPDYEVFFLEAHDTRPAVFLFNVRQEEGIRKKLIGLLENIVMKEGIQLLHISVGGLYASPLAMNASYCEALVAAHFQDQKIGYFQKTSATVCDFLCPSTEGKIFQQSLLSGSERTAIDILRRMSSIAEQQQLPLFMTRCFCFYVACLILQICSNIEKDFPMEDLLFAANYADLKLFTFTAETAIYQICRGINCNRQVNEEQKEKELMDYIRKNFGDYSLSAESLSEHFGISAHTIRQIVKERTGYNLSVLLTQLRMEYIKQQLIQTNLSIREIIEQAGYTDVSSFTRKFRQSEGVTPGQYRAMMRSVPPVQMPCPPGSEPEMQGHGSAI